MFSRHIISPNNFGGVSNIFDGDVQSGDQLSFPTNLASCCCSEQMQPNCVLEHDRFGSGIVMVWAGIRHNGRTALVRLNVAINAQIYRDEIQQHQVVLLTSVTGGIFQHDNARPHTARVCRDFLQQNNIYVLPWSARSADLSLIGTAEVVKGILRHKHYRNWSLLYRINGNTFPIPNSKYRCLHASSLCSCDCSP